MPRDLKNHRCTDIIDGKYYTWYVLRLMELAKELPVREVPLEEFEEIVNKVWWFGQGIEPTISNVVDHFRRVQETDLEYPIILNSNGNIMDGGHRLAKAMLEGCETIKVVQFEVMPEPDRIDEEFFNPE